MATLFHNITGSSGVDITLLNPGDDVDVKSIIIANTHASNDATVSLFIQNTSTDSSGSDTFYIFSTVAIPSDTSLVIDKTDIPSFDNGEDGFGLFLTVGSSDTLDVLISENTSTLI
tara:strand:- start:72 stop:419 length:348 start_codon:yes stop_codon:yes gene_type:complete